jgi:5,6-dimethylbenzimidazole synthase
MMHEPLAQLLERTYSAAEREVIYRLIRGGGQVRHFAADPIPLETLQRILDAALDAPFVGGMPPWQLILVTSPALRARITAAVGEGRERDASPRPDDRGQARSLTLTRARLAEAPLHLAVTYDHGGGPVGLERALDPSMDIFRACGALQNLWLAACAEGLGVEWVRPADEGAVARLLALPPGVQLLAYLGLGMPQAVHRRPRRAAGDGRAQRRRESRVYTDRWGQTGGSLVACMTATDEPDSLALAESTSGRGRVMREGRMNIHEAPRFRC